MGRLDGRVAIVTGGGRGIGVAYCKALAAEGAKVVVSDILDTDRTVAAIREAGRVIQHVLASLQLGLGVDQGMAHGLVAADGLTELDAFLRVAPCVGYRGFGQAEGHSGDLELLDVERLSGKHRPPAVPAVVAADYEVGRDLGVFERDI